MGCPSGNCPVIAVSPEAGGEKERDLVQSLAMEGREFLTTRSPCCAFCAGIELDPSVEPEHAGKVLKRGRACPISVVAYRAAIESKKGRPVTIVPRGNLPALVVDGEELDPLADFTGGECATCS